MSEQYDEIAKPRHYNIHPSGVEAIQVTEHMTFNLGNAVKYIWRSGIKDPNVLQDLMKASWYIQREILRISLLKKQEEDCAHKDRNAPGVQQAESEIRPNAHRDSVVSKPHPEQRDDKARDQPVPAGEKTWRHVSEHCPDCEPWRRGGSFEVGKDAP